MGTTKCFALQGWLELPHISKFTYTEYAFTLIDLAIKSLKFILLLLSKKDNIVGILKQNHTKTCFNYFSVFFNHWRWRKSRNRKSTTFPTTEHIFPQLGLRSLDHSIWRRARNNHETHHASLGTQCWPTCYYRSRQCNLLIIFIRKPIPWSMSCVPSIAKVPVFLFCKIYDYKP